MAASDLLKLAEDYIGDYLQTLLRTVRRPDLSLAPVHGQATLLISQRITGSASKSELRLNPRLPGFVLISMVAGFALTSFLQEQHLRTEHWLPAIARVGVLVSAYWVLFACAMHLECRILRGSGTFLETFTMVLQVLSALYVVASTLALIWSTGLDLLGLRASGYWRPASFSAELFGWWQYPALMFVNIHLLLLALYLPWAFRRIHGSAIPKQVIVGLTVIAVGGVLKAGAYRYLLALPALVWVKAVGATT